MRVPYAVEPGLIVEVYGINDKRIALPMPDRISHPRGTESGIMHTAIRENLTPQGIVFEEHQYLAWDLKDLQRRGLKENTWHAGRNAAPVNGIICL
jgi:hypothetical protein